jgi:FkbM family methyltransferase
MGGIPELRTRAGSTFTVPPGDKTWWTIVEVFGQDSYRLADLAVDGGAPMILDVGANIGAFAIAVCARWPEARVICFEPAPIAYDALVKNIEQNGCVDRVETAAKAVTGRSWVSTVTLFERPADSSTSTVVESLAGRPDSSPGHWTQVSAVALDDIVGSIAGSVHCLKLDVEGAEYDIVADTSLDTLRRFRCAVVEYHPVPGRELDELVKRFRSASMTWSHWERSTEPGRGTCWFTAETSP